MVPMSNGQSAVITGHRARAGGVTDWINMYQLYCRAGQESIAVLIDPVTEPDAGHEIKLAWQLRGLCFTCLPHAST